MNSFIVGPFDFQRGSTSTVAKELLESKTLGAEVVVVVVVVAVVVVGISMPKEYHSGGLIARSFLHYLKIYFVKKRLDRIGASITYPPHFSKKSLTESVGNGGGTVSSLSHPNFHIS